MCHWTNGIARAFICLTTYGTTATKFNFGQRQRATMIPSGSSSLLRSIMRRGSFKSAKLDLGRTCRDTAQNEINTHALADGHKLNTRALAGGHTGADVALDDASGLSSSKNSSSGRGRRLANVVCTLLLVLGALGLFSTHYHAEPILQNLRSRRSSILPIHQSDDIVDSDNSSRLPSPTTARKRKLERQGVGCGAYVDEDSCNTSQEDKKRPSKSDITACERV